MNQPRILHTCWYEVSKPKESKLQLQLVLVVIEKPNASDLIHYMVELLVLRFRLFLREEQSKILVLPISQLTQMYFDLLEATLCRKEKKKLLKNSNFPSFSCKVLAGFTSVEFNIRIIIRIFGWNIFPYSVQLKVIHKFETSITIRSICFPTDLSIMI